MSSRKEKQCGLGRALKKKLERKRYTGYGERAPIFYQESETNEAEDKKMKMKSVLDQNNLTAFMQVAEMSQQDFHANRNIKFSEIREEVNNKRIILVGDGRKDLTETYVKGNELKGLQVPRRPKWQDTDSKLVLEQAQNQAYLNWRRKLAEVEESADNLEITPYEKNLEVWRQLWRVVERTQVLVQIIDGRNPLFFFSEDLFEYAREMGKGKFMLIINKSDLVEEPIRDSWNKYFKKLGIDHCFFTAKEGKIEEGNDIVANNTSRVLSPQQLITVLKKYAKGNDEVEIGFVGYPNVGKSSVINAVMGRKRVGVAAMPGKTKHFQTLKLVEGVTLCDCPGLVFPKVHASRSEMVLNGLFSIDTLKQYEQPLELIAFRIPRHKLQALYFLHWKENEPYDGESILIKYATLKGYFGGNGSPICATAARYILKDYVNGILVYSYLPPGESKEMTFQARQKQIEFEKINYQKAQDRTEENLDEHFFEKEEVYVRTAEDVAGGLNQEDFLDIIEGRKIDGFRITKEIRKEIKFAMKRGDKADQLRKILLGRGIFGSVQKTLIKN